MAGSGDFDSCFDLGVIYTTGSYGQKKNVPEAIKWWTKAAKNNIVDAAFNLAVLYHYGKGIDKDLEKAAEFYDLAHQLGNSNATAELAALQPALAALRARAQRTLSMDAPTESTEAALEWYMAASDRGDTQAMFKLGNMYARGDMGLEVDFLKAGEWWATAATEGHADALHNLLVHADDSVPADEIVGIAGGAKDWTRITAKLEEPLAKALPALQFLVSNMYRFGHGVERSEAQTAAFLYKSAAGNCPDAMYSLACLHDEGGFEGVPKDGPKAKELMLKAADMKHQGAAIWCKRSNVAR
jgi:TPR repeat protein